jgi:hypothetical protein
LFAVKFAATAPGGIGGNFTTFSFGSSVEVRSSDFSEFPDELPPSELPGFSRLLFVSLCGHIKKPKNKQANFIACAMPDDTTTKVRHWGDHP